MDAYDYWRAELANPKSLPRDTTRRDICGFYRIHKVKTKPDYPIAIWSDENVLYVQIGRAQPIDEANNKEEFDRFFSTNWYHAVAIPEEQYREVMVDGWWPFVDGFSKTAWARPDGQVFRIFGDVTATPASEGGNQPPEEVAFEQLKADIERKVNEVEQVGAIKTIEQVQSYRALQDTLNALNKRADAGRVKEKRPHDEASAAVQAKWMPIVTAAKKWADYARDTADAWLKEQDRINRQKAAEEAAAIARENERLANEHAEQQRLAEREAEARAQAGEFLPEPAAVPEPELKPMPPAPTPLKVSGSPFSSARKARTIITGKITDEAKLIAYLVEQRDAGLLEFLQNRANAAAKMKISLPGVERVES